MSLSAQDVQDVLDVQGILASGDVANAKPGLVLALVNWKYGSAPTPAPVSAPAPKGKADKATTPSPDPSEEPAF